MNIDTYLMYIENHSTMGETSMPQTRNVIDLTTPSPSFQFSLSSQSSGTEAKRTPKKATRTQKNTPSSSPIYSLEPVKQRYKPTNIYRDVRKYIAGTYMDGVYPTCWSNRRMGCFRYY